jgi:hypothetical protein
MTDKLVLEAGKTYVFINEESMEDYLHDCTENAKLLAEYYLDGFTLDKVEERDGYVGEGFVNKEIVIAHDEIIFFEEKTTTTKQLDIFYYKTDGGMKPDYVHSTVPHMENVGWALLHKQTVTVEVPDIGETDEEKALKESLRAEITKAEEVHKERMDRLKERLNN